MEDIRIVQWGLGAMGSGMVKLLAERKGVRVVGAVSRNPAVIGRDLGSVLGLPDTGVLVSGDPEAVLAETAPDLVLHATSSFFKEIYPQLMQAVEANCHVITIAEEMAEPWTADPALASEIDRAARQRGVAVVGTGINPGFVFDALVIALSGVCHRIEKIEAERVNDLAPFGPTVMATQGVGVSPGEFRRGVAEGTIAGHIGFPQSIRLIARALGWRLERVREEKEPIIARTFRQTPYVRVEPGMVAGCDHSAYGYAGGKEVIVLKHPQQVQPEAEGVETGDFIRIHGTPSLDLALRPEIPGGIGSIGLAVNMIPILLNSEPGLKTMLELPNPAAWLGGLREESREESVRESSLGRRVGAGV